tara:strand:- start:108 stop:548 length:441 start_codon:yes stop_codon:yes gene_type:complete
MIEIICNNETSLSCPNFIEIEKIAMVVFNEQNIKDGDISFIFSSDELLSNLKMEFFGENLLTDVIAFRLNDYLESTIEGEIYISLQRAKENSKIYDQPYPKEIARLIIHGCLHLIGFNDRNNDEKILMNKMENNFLNKVNWKDIFT